MTAGLPCPNPTCNYTFPLAQVKGVSSLKCPTCGTVFQFGAGAAQAPAAGRPAAPRPKARPVPPPAPAPPPLARRAVVPRPAPAVARPQPAAPAAPAAKVGSDFPTGPIVTPRLDRLRSRRGRWPAIIGGVLVMLIVAGFVVGVVVLMTLNRGPRDDDTTGSDPNTFTRNGFIPNLQGKDERAFRLLLPRDVWKGSDGDKIKKGLKAVVGLERSNPDAWLAVAVQDYGTKMPREAELLKGAIDRLEGYFGDNLELGERPEPGELAGQPAQVIQFRGSINSVDWTGECYALARHGLAYWLFVAGTPDREAAQKILAELQADKKGLVLDDERRGWSVQQPKYAAYAGLNGSFVVKGREGVWESLDNAKEEDPNAELLLHGRNLEDRKDNLKSARVLVLALKKEAPDLKAAMKAAREYLEASKKQDGKGYQVGPVVDKKGEGPPLNGTPQKIGDRPGQVAELQIKLDGVPAKYVLLGVVRAPGRLYVIQCEAHWQNHQAWRRDFLDLLGTFQLRGG